jgi:hypothetical protein
MFIMRKERVTFHGVSAERRTKEQRGLLVFCSVVVFLVMLLDIGTSCGDRTRGT